MQQGRFRASGMVTHHHHTPSTLLSLILDYRTGGSFLASRRGSLFPSAEEQVLSYVFEGLANKEIAVRIGVSESSVKATLQQLFSKTGVRTRSQLVRIVLEQHRDQI